MRKPSPNENPKPRTAIRNVSPPSPRENPTKGVYTSVCGNNSELMEKIASLYFKPGLRIADTTYGKGVFWKNIDTTQYDFHRSDLITCPEAKFDCCNLPYAKNSFHIVAFDPPYIHNPNRPVFEGNYRNWETTKGLDHSGIIRLYEAGMNEAKRILEPGGLLLVKCMDEIESGRQRWSHIEVYEIALRLCMRAQDLFVMTPKQAPLIQCKQKHARKNHSYMWIFKKCG